MATWTMYQDFTEQLLKGNHDLDGGSFKVMLTTSTHTPSATDTTTADLDNEVSGTNYTAGGAALSSLAVTESSGTATWDAADVTWSQSATGFSDAKNAHIYNVTGTLLICYATFSADKGNVDGDLTLSIADIFDLALS